MEKEMVLLESIIEEHEKSEKMKKDMNKFKRLKNPGYPLNIINDYTIENKAEGMLRYLFSLAAIKYIDNHYDEIEDEDKSEEEKVLLQYCAVSRMLIRNEVMKISESLNISDGFVVCEFYEYIHGGEKPNSLSNNEIKLVNDAFDDAFDRIFDCFLKGEK